MKKRILTVLMVLIMALTGSQAWAFADTATPYFNAVTLVETGIANDDGTIRYNITTNVSNTTKVDMVHIDAKLLRGSGTVTVVSYSQDLYSDCGTFIFSGYKKVSTTGAYFLKYTLTCYKDGEVVDTITGCTKTVTYTA